MRRQFNRFLRWPFVLAGGVVFGWMLSRNWVKQLRFPQLRLVQQGLTKKYGEVEAAFLAGRIQQRYEELYKHRPRFRDCRLQFHVNQSIIPVLALYQVLLDQAGNSQRALTEVQELIIKVVMGKGGFMIRLLQYFFDPFSVLRRAVRFVNRTAFPASGWDIQYTVDDRQAIAFNIHGCLYMNVLSAYGVPELTQVFCQFDDAIAELFPSQITWKRESTLARGGSLCDFRYERVQDKAGIKE